MLKKSAPFERGSYIALKANTGLLLNISYLFTKIEVSYDTVQGFSVGAGIGLALEAY